ncbi:MAG: dihydroorotase [Suipraeoptans sp.]
MTDDIYANYIKGIDKSIASPEKVITRESIPKVDLIIENGNVIIPDQGILKTNVYVKDGRVYALGNMPDIGAKKTINAVGKYVCPGIIDPHVHLGMFADLEMDMNSETKAALVGGVTTTGVFIGGDNSHFKTIDKYKEAIDNNAYTDILPHLVIGTNEQKNEMREYAYSLGITSFKIYMNGIPEITNSVTDDFILDVFEQIKVIDKNAIVCCHTENNHIVSRAVNVMKKLYAKDMTIDKWADTHPAMAEVEAINRIAYLAELSKTPVYLVHISSKEGIERLRQIKPFNKYINVETTSPYLGVCDKDCKDAKFKMEPPIRKREDQNALWSALDDGVIDTIGTDNVCETLKEKRFGENFWDVVPGYSVIESHLAVTLTEGVVKRNKSIEKVIKCMTKKPAELFGIYPKKGTILPGSDADIVLFDIKKSDIIEPSKQVSRTDFSIYEGMEVFGSSCMTIKEGKVVVQNGIVLESGRTGKMLTR